MDLAEKRQGMAWRPGTDKNHRSVLAAFVSFLEKYNISFLQVTDEIVCIYFEHCLQSVKSPATIQNYAGALTTCYRRMGLDVTPFQSYKVKNALVGVKKNVRHVPAPSLPVTPALLKRVIRLVNLLPDGYTISFAFILMFHTFCRQSNFSSTTASLFDPTRQFVRRDVIVRRDGLLVHHKWSKSRQMASHQATLMVPALSGNPLCPKDAYLRMERVSPTRYPTQPLLVFSDGNHIPGPYLRKVWRAALVALAIPNHESYSLHGIRRGAATFVISNDATAREDIKRHGFWASDAVDQYLPKTNSKVFETMKKL